MCDVSSCYDTPFLLTKGIKMVAMLDNMTGVSFQELVRKNKSKYSLLHIYRRKLEKQKSKVNDDNLITNDMPWVLFAMF